MTREDRLELALRRILSDSCERTPASGPGACYRQGHSDVAYFLADRCCDTCIAHKALYPDHEKYREAS